MPSVSDLASKHFQGKENVFASNRAISFLTSEFWPYKNKESTLSPEKMAEAGWMCTGTKSEVASGRCPFCGKELLFDDGDDPWAEHVKRGTDCEYVKLGKRDENTWTVGEYLLLLGALNAQQDLTRMRADLESLLNVACNLKKAVNLISK